MKRIAFSFILFYSLLIFACYDFTNLETPETVSVSSTANYELPAGELSFNIKDKLNIAHFREVLENNSKGDNGMVTSLAVYDYNPTQKDDDVLQFVINYPIKEIPVSLTNDSNIDDVSFSTSFSIPKLETDIIDAMKVDTPEPIFVKEGFDASISDIIDDPNVFFRITSPDFDIMTLRNGTLKVKFTFNAEKSYKFTDPLTGTKIPVAAPSDDFSMPIKLTLVSEDDRSVVIAVSDEVDCKNGGTVELDLAGANLVPKMLLCMEGSISGGSLNQFNSYDVSISPSDIEIAKIIGLNMDLGDDAKVDIDETFSLSGMNDALKKASIKKGSVGFACTLPDGWSGVSCEKSKFVLSGGINVPSEKFIDKTVPPDLIRKEADLSGTELIPDEISTTGSSLEIGIKDATIVFSENGDDKVTLTGICKIDEIGEIVFDLGPDILKNLSGDIDTGLNLSTLLSDLLEGEETGLINNFKFSGIRGFVYLMQSTENEVLKGLNMHGYISASYKGSSEPLYITGSAEEDAQLTMKSSKKTIASFADENYMITSDEPFESLYSVKVNDGVMDQLLNEHPDGLVFSYKFAVGGGETGTEITLNQSDFELLKSSSALSVSLAIIIPLQFILDDVTDGDSSDKTIFVDDVLALVGTNFDEDMFNREGPTEGDDWLEYTPFIEYAMMEYELENRTPLDKLKVTFFDENSDITKSLDTSSGKHELKFTNEEAERICKTYPFTPKIKVEIGDADGVTPKIFRRNASLRFGAILEVQGSGKSIKVWEKDKKDKSSDKKTKTSAETEATE